MSSKRLDSISDYYRQGYDLRVACRGCDHVAVLDALELSQECQHRGWSRRIDRIEARLKCSNCGCRDMEVAPALRDD